MSHQSDDCHSACISYLTLDNVRDSLYTVYPALYISLHHDHSLSPPLSIRDAKEMTVSPGLVKASLQLHLLRDLCGEACTCHINHTLMHSGKFCPRLLVE